MRILRLASLWIFTTAIIFVGLHGAQAQEPIEVVIFPDADSLTIYIEGNQQISLQNVGLEVVVGEQRNTYFLDSYPGFATLRFDQIQLPICFRLVRDGVAAATPLECPTERTLTQNLAASNIFWYDTQSAGTRTLLLVRGSETIDFCPAGQTTCTIALPNPSPETPPAPTEVPSFPTPTEAPSTPLPTDAPSDGTESDPFPDGLGRSLDNPVTSNDEWTPVVRKYDGVEMVLVPAGCFMMGSKNEDNERPINPQCVENPLWIDRTEVSQKDFKRFDGTNEESSCFSGNDRPVECITWFEARDFCQLRGMRLPTEQEWEYAARGPDNLMYPWGDEWNNGNVVWYGNSGQETAEVGSILAGASWVGALDMSGNVSEWVNTIYDQDRFPYPYDKHDGREDDKQTSELRILRGGSFIGAQDKTNSTIRNFRHPSEVLSFWGFRCANDFEE